MPELQLVEQPQCYLRGLLPLAEASPGARVPPCMCLKSDAVPLLKSLNSVSEK